MTHLSTMIYFLCLCSLSLAQTHSDPQPPPITRDTSTNLSDSAISLLLEKNRLPPTMESFRKAMEKNWGPTKANIVPFSDAPGETNLDEARKLYGSESGELFIGTIHREDDTVDFEFISRNAKTGKNDFGIVRNYGKPNEEVGIVNRDACVTCHKSGGPIFMRDGWTNTVGNNRQSRALFKAFMERLAIREPKYRPIQERLEKILAEEDAFEKKMGHAPIPSLQNNTNLKQKLRDEFGEIASWHGIDLTDQIGDSANFEITAARANQFLVLDSFVRQGKDASDRVRRSRSVLEKAIHGSFPMEGNDDFYKGFKGIPENRNVILEDRMANVFKNRILKDGTSLEQSKDGETIIPEISKEQFLEYSLTKKREKFRNTIEEFSPTKESNFQLHSESVAVGAKHFGQLNAVYHNRLSDYFQPLFAADQGIDENTFGAPDTVGKKLKKKFYGLHPEGLKGDESQKKVVSKFEKDTLDEFLNSPHLKKFLEKGILPTPVITHSLFKEFVLGVPPSRVPLNPDQVQSLNKEKKCLDCHSHADMVGRRNVFNFEFSDINAWKKELSSHDSGRAEHARHWLSRTLEHLEEGTMPPPPQFKLNLSDRERTELVEYLRSQSK